MAVISVWAIAVAAILALMILVVAVITLSTVGGRRAAGKVLLHAAWIVPVLAFAGGVVWLRAAQPPPLPDKPASTAAHPGEHQTTQLGLSDRDPSRSIFETTESRTVEVTAAQTTRFAPIGIFSLVVIGAVLFVALGARRALGKHLGATITVVGVLGFLGILAVGAGALYLTSQRQVVMSHQGRMELAAISTDAILATSAPSQVLDYRGATRITEQGEGPTIVHDGAAAAEPTTEVIAYRGSDPVGQRLAAPPEWIDEEGVITSDLWATTEEAERQLLHDARIELRDYLAIEYPQAAEWTPSAGHVTDSGAIIRRCHEIVPMEFNGYTEPMYRVSWQLELTPAVRHSLFQDWRPLIVQQRILWLAVGIGVVSLVLGTIGTYFRVDRATDGAYRGRLKFAATAMCVAACLVPLLLA